MKLLDIATDINTVYLPAMDGRLSEDKIGFACLLIIIVIFIVYHVLDSIMFYFKHFK